MQWTKLQTDWWNRFATDTNLGNQLKGFNARRVSIRLESIVLFSPKAIGVDTVD